jgi:hypothetical protein
VPILTPCPGPPSPTPPTPPAVSAVHGSATGYRTAGVGGTINPDGDATTYYWVADNVAEQTPPRRTRSATIPAGTSAVSVSGTLTGLTPDTRYDLTLVATNAVGMSNSLDFPAFTTPEHVRLSLSAPDRDSIQVSFQMSLTLRIHASGAFSPYVPVRFQYAVTRNRWRLAANTGALGPHGNAKADFCPPAADNTGCPIPQQNFWVRAVYDQTKSRPLREYVYPETQVSVEREAEGTSPWLDPELVAYVHFLPHRHAFRTEPVYFYEGPGRRGPFVLVARSHFRVDGNRRPSDAGEGGATLLARARVYHPGGGITYACFPHQILPDMGRRFLQRWCGRRRLG